MPDPQDRQRPDFWVQTGPTADHDEASVRRHPDVFQISRGAVLEACIVEILRHDLGFAASASARTGVLGNGEPIPLMSYSLVEYLMGIDLTAFDVLEIGGGNSTLFWARRARSVLTFEHDRAWIDDTYGLPDNVEIRHINQNEYSEQVRALAQSFSLIVIDCAANRYACAVAIKGKLSPGGLVILDNSDWYPNAASELRDQGLIQVDYADFRPDHWYRCNTSLFVHPEFRPKPLTDRMPAKTLGGKDLGFNNSWDLKV